MVDKNKEVILENNVQLASKVVELQTKVYNKSQETGVDKMLLVLASNMLVSAMQVGDLGNSSRLLSRARKLIVDSGKNKS